jgi:hypothetical protein
LTRVGAPRHIAFVSWRSLLGAATESTLPDKVTRHWIPSGDAGTVATVRIMVRLARADAAHPLVRSMAAKIVQPASGRDGVAQAGMIRRWLGEHIAFLRDPAGTELLHTPVRLLAMIGAARTIHVDCDDAAILGASLGKAVGLLSRFVVVGFRSPTAPYQHVWTELSNPVGSPRWVELDITRAAQNISPAMISRRLTVRV